MECSFDEEKMLIIVYVLKLLNNANKLIHYLSSFLEHVDYGYVPVCTQVFLNCKQPVILTSNLSLLAHTSDNL